MKRRMAHLESPIKVYVLSKSVQKSFIFRTVLLSGNNTMEDVWGAYQMTSLQPAVLARLLKQRSNLRAAIRLPRERSIKVCLTSQLLPSQRMSPSTCLHYSPPVPLSVFLDSLDCRVLLMTFSWSLCHACCFLTSDLHSVLLSRRNRSAVQKTSARLLSRSNSASLMLNSRKSCLACAIWPEIPLWTPRAEPSCFGA